MTKSEVASRARETGADLAKTADQARGALQNGADALRDGADELGAQLPAAFEALQAGARATSKSMRTMPEENLRLMLAMSAGLGVGLYMAGSPRLVTLAALAPALLIAGVWMSRPMAGRAH